MIKKLIGAVVLFVIGYVAGVHGGFKAAVNDYVNNDAQMLERGAERMFSDEEAPEGLKEALEEASGAEADGDFGKAFQ